MGAVAEIIAWVVVVIDKVIAWHELAGEFRVGDVDAGIEHGYDDVS